MTVILPLRREDKKNPEFGSKFAGYGMAVDVTSGSIRKFLHPTCCGEKSSVGSML